LGVSQIIGRVISAIRIPTYNIKISKLNTVKGFRANKFQFEFSGTAVGFIEKQKKDI